jgi:DNA repair photolyase
MSDEYIDKRPQKGRGAVTNPTGRYEQHKKVAFADGWFQDQEKLAQKTEYNPETIHSIISHNDSPDIPFSQSINPYRGCEHGCVYCYARPTHSYWGLSGGLDFETKIFYKDEAVKYLEKELSAINYRCQWIALGANTDPYQPIEKERKITRRLLEVMRRYKQPVGIVTKSQLVTRDIDILADMAKEQLAEVTISVTTLDNDLKRKCGANHAGYVFLRLPFEVKDLFSEWLDVHYPLKKDHVLSLVSQSRGGKLNVSEFRERMRGSGEYAELINQRFKLALKKYGYALPGRGHTLRTDLFKVPGRPQQIALFSAE